MLKDGFGHTYLPAGGGEVFLLKGLLHHLVLAYCCAVLFS